MFIPGRRSDDVWSNFFGDVFGAGDASLLVGVDRTPCITARGRPPCINDSSCGSVVSCTEQRRRNFLHLWLILLFHRFKSVDK